MDIDKKSLLKKFQDESTNIITKMVRILMVAQRKVDDKKYRETLKRLKQT